MRFKTIKQFFEKHERLLMPATLILGTAVDFVTFLTINIEATFWILGVYYMIAAGCIFVLNTRKEERLRLLAKFLMQFTFGALLSASLVFYWFSGAISVSWPIMILLALLMVSNEVFKEYYLKPIVQISAFYFVSFSLAALMLPYARNSLDPIWFVVAGVASFLLVWRSEEHTSELQSQSNLVCRPFFFNDTATTEIYTLSLHDALPIYSCCRTLVIP